MFLKKKPAKLNRKIHKQNRTMYNVAEHIFQNLEHKV